MSSAPESTIPVLVVGAGPTGLALSVELARHGASCRIVDALPEPSPQTKATEIHARTLELLDQAGLAEAFVAGGVVIKGAGVHSRGRRIAGASFGGGRGGRPGPRPFHPDGTAGG